MPTDGEAYVSYTLDNTAAFEHGSNDNSSDDGGDELTPTSTHPNVSSSFSPINRSRIGNAIYNATRRVDKCVVALS